MLKDYAKADREYKKIIDGKWAGTDYALFQRAIVQGLQGNFSDKTRLLQNLINDYPQSSYHDDALYENGNTHLTLGNASSAQASFDRLLQKYPNGPFTSRALLKQALLAYNASQYDQALQYYQQVARDYKGSPEGREAVAGIRDISVETARPELYTQMAGVSAAERDSVTWNAAYQRYLTGDCAAALPGLNRYLDDFANGFFADPAHFYRAECRYKDGAYREALPDYEHVLRQKHSRFTETSLLKAARIAFFETQEYQKATTWYGQLYAGAEFKGNAYEALKGLVRAHFALANYPEAIQYGTNWAESPEASGEERVEANYYVGKSYLAMGRKNEAYNLFGQVSRASSNVYGAEARYWRAQLEFERGEYEKAKNSCLDLIQTTAYEEWVIRSYLLVADVLREEGQFVQARAALSSIIDNYSGNEALLAEARKKLREIEAIERSRSRLDESNELEFLESDPALPSLENTKNP
jgi:TolA-binding protein